jgi:hypothetical protein
MANGELPRYVEFGGNPRYQAPFTVKGCRMYGFFVPAAFTRLCELFSKCLNTPSGGAVEFLPVGLPDFAYVLFSFVDMQHQSAREPELGWVREREFTIFVPGVDLKCLRNGDKASGLFIPYIFVDSDAALIVGREAYGFPKRLGGLTFPPPEDPAMFALDTLVIPGTTSQTEAVTKHLVEIRSTAAKAADADVRIIPGFEELCHEIAHRVFGGSIALTKADEFLVDVGKELGLGVPLVFLKQVRDAAVQDRASYQAIVASSFQLTGFGGAKLLGDYAITLNDYPSDPIREELGLPAGVLNPKLSFCVEFDFIVPPGRILWQSGTTA